MKITTKTWLAKVATIFIYITSLVHRISILGFFNSKIKKCIFLVSILLLVFFYFRYACLNYLPFSCYKEQREQHKISYWKRKIKQTLSKESYHIICSFTSISLRISLLQLSVSYILRENSFSKGKISDNKNFIKLFTNQNFYL